ncbi:MAG: hypothetical protein EOM14_15550 [Clostridia bacterium]|nr:hypothetical protein [Clostridia bacterium]
MDRIIENEFLRVKVKDMGAELAQIFNKKTGKDLLWSGDAAWWNRTSPLLFPSVGKSKNGQYNCIIYKLAPHNINKTYNTLLLNLIHKSRLILNHESNSTKLSNRDKL